MLCCFKIAYFKTIILLYQYEVLSGLSFVNKIFTVMCMYIFFMSVCKIGLCWHHAVATCYYIATLHLVVLVEVQCCVCPKPSVQTTFWQKRDKSQSFKYEKKSGLHYRSRLRHYLIDINLAALHEGETSYVHVWSPAWVFDTQVLVTPEVYRIMLKQATGVLIRLIGIHAARMQRCTLLVNSSRTSNPH